jgi:hypothetical protein
MMDFCFSKKMKKEKKKTLDLNPTGPLTLWKALGRDLTPTLRIEKSYTYK